MSCRILVLVALFCGWVSVAVAQQPRGGGDRSGGFSEDEGGAQDQGGRGGRQRGGFGGRGPRENLMFTAIDADGDGAINARELRRAAAALKTLDADEDGIITLEEASPQRGPGGGPGGDPSQFVDRIMESDTNGDGMLTPDEVPEQMAQMLTDADVNGDGAIDREELTQAMQNFRGRGGRGGRGGAGGGAGGGNADPEAMYNQLMGSDQNGDGVLSPQEVPQQMMGMLRGADTNGDGFLNANEVRQALEASQQRRQRFRGGQQGQGGGFDPQQRGRRGPQE